MKPGQLLFPGTVSAPRRARAAALALLWPVAVVAATLIRDATLVDGTGAPRREGSVRVAAGRIVEMGELRPEPGEEVVSGHGLVLAPGFIDAHSHVDELILEQPDALAAVSQGITTAIVGQDGESPYPLADFFARLRTQPPAINLAAFAGHGTLRRRVLGREIGRRCREAELAAMSLLLEQELRAGALGLSTGLEYNPGIYSDTAELVALARVAARAGGRYVSHIRSEDRRFWEAISPVRGDQAPEGCFCCPKTASPDSGSTRENRAMSQSQSHATRRHTVLPEPLRCLTPELVARIDEAICRVGQFGEVRLVLVRGELRFIQVTVSENVNELRRDADAE